jgi:hypothetical protein
MPASISHETGKFGIQYYQRHEKKGKKKSHQPKPAGSFHLMG